ncbi:MAG: hypothetical protein M0Z49_04385 [Chloroflexi bacterium]|nr:hypothetical protein [Chloroflexota bacterium]MDA8236445.1 hypothetical protein [Chloroflexota bacterium]
MRQRPPLGPIRVTPTRLVFLVAVTGTIGYLVYAITVRDATQIPMLASGAAVLGIIFAALAIAGAVETVRAARADRPARSVAAAVFGGVAGIVAFGCFAAAVVLALLVGAA